MSSSGFRGVVQGISLRTLTAWPTVIAAVTLVLLTFTAGDSPDPNANTGAYWLGAVGQVALAGALLVAAAISARMLNLNVTGPAAIGVLFAASFAAALIVRPPGSLYTTYRANGELLPTVVVALFITVVWTIVAVAVHAVRQYRQQSQDLKALEQEIQRELESLDARAEADHRQVKDALETTANEALRSVGSQAPHLMAAAIRELADRHVRAASHGLSAKDPDGKEHPQNSTDSTVASAARRLTARDPVPPLGIAVLYALLYGAWLLLIYPPAVAAVILIALVAIIVCFAYLVNWVTRPLLPRLSVPLRMLLIYALTIPLLALLLRVASIGYDLGYAFEAGEGLLSTPLTLFVEPLVLLGFIWVRIFAAAIAAKEEQRGERAQALQHQLVVRRMQVRQQRKAWAQALHGQVQSAMLAAAFRLERGLASGQLDDAYVKSACEPIWRALDAAQTATADSPPWDTVVCGLQALWGSVIDLTATASPAARAALQRDPLCRTSITEIVTEAVSNAVRHGRATRVEITVEAEGEDVVDLTISDNGTPNPEWQRRGLGSALYDEASISWAIRRTEDGTTLTLQVPTTGAAETPAEQAPAGDHQSSSST